MADPGTVSDGTIVSTSGYTVADGLLGLCTRTLVEASPGSFQVDAAPNGPLGGLPDPSYTYVGDALNQYDGHSYQVFYSGQDDGYYVSGIDNIKYYLYGYSSAVVLPDGTYSTVHTDYTATAATAGLVTQLATTRR